MSSKFSEKITVYRFTKKNTPTPGLLFFAFCNVTNNSKAQSTPQYKKHTFWVIFWFFNCPNNDITVSWIKPHRPKCSTLKTVINIRSVFILGISTGNSSKRWKNTGSLEEVLDVVKKHEIEETARFNTYSSAKDFGLTGKKRFDYVMFYLF